MKKFKISNDEVAELSNAPQYEFPKYVTQVINLVNSNAGGTRPKVVGQMSELVKEFDMAQGCAGTSSEIAKKTLLFMALQKQLRLELPARALPRIHSFPELTALVIGAMRETEFWRPRLAGG